MCIRDSVKTASKKFGVVCDMFVIKIPLRLVNIIILQLKLIVVSEFEIRAVK